MTRFAVSAARDPKAPAIPRPTADDWTAALIELSTEEAEILLLVSTVLCPHSWLPADSYRSVVLAVDHHIAGMPEDGLALHTLVAQVASWNGIPFAGLSPGNRTKILESLSDTPPFLTTLRLVCRYLYDLPEVWSACGYDGAAGLANDAPRRDFDDGPMPEVG